MKSKNVTGSVSTKLRIRILLALTIHMWISLYINLEAQSFDLYAVSDLKRVYADGYQSEPGWDTLTIFGIRGEIISGQFVVAPEKDLASVTIRGASLTNQKTGDKLPEENITWNFTGGIRLSANTPNQPEKALSKPAPAIYPDYLMPERHLAIAGNQFQPVWLTIDLPGDLPDGEYRGEIIVEALNEKMKLPVRLVVYPFNMPEERHLNVAEWYSTEGFSRFYKITDEYSEPWFSMLGVYAENMALHRQNVFRVDIRSVSIIKNREGSFEFDFTNFDRIAETFWETSKMDFLETGFLTRFGKDEWFSREISLKDFEVWDVQGNAQIIVPGEELVPALLISLEQHLREKKWLDRTLFHVKDEPSLHNALAWKEMSSYIHRYAPDLRRIDAIETAFLLDDIEVAVPKLDALGTWYDSFSSWRDQGNELWFYTVGIYQGSFFPNKTIDMPLLESRIIHWMNYRYKASGYLHWGWNQWNEDPYEDPGEHCGDAWLVYPVAGGVVNSLRWEQMRNGIQDYEYFWLLENRFSELKDSLGSRFSWIDPHIRGSEIAGRVVPGLTSFTKDPEIIYNARLEILNELISLDTYPRAILQTDPEENSLLTNHSSVAVLGWTDFGTRIFVNGQEVPVSENGMFMEQFTLDIDYQEENPEFILRITASTSSAEKVIIRRFNVRN